MKKKTNLENKSNSLSKRKLYHTLLNEGIWEIVKQYMENADIWEDWEYATTLDKDDPLILSAINALKNSYGFTEDKISSILENSVID